MERGTLPPEARADLDTAVTLTLVALILEVVFLAIGILVFAVFVLLGSFPLQMGMPGFSISVGFFVGLLVVFGIVGVVFLLLLYFLVYKRLKDEQVESALTPALVLGIIALVLVGVISGILLIVAYMKAKDAHTKILLAQSAPS